MILEPGREEGPHQVEGGGSESAAADAEEESDDHAENVPAALTERAQDVGRLGIRVGRLGIRAYEIQLADFGEDGDESGGGGGGRVVRVLEREGIG